MFRNYPHAGLLLGSILLLCNVRAQTFTDAFAYGGTPQPLTMATSTWTAHSAIGVNMVLYSNTGLLSPPGYPQAQGGAVSIAGGSGSREDVNDSIITISNGKLYAAFLVQFSAAGSDYFFHLNLTSHNARVYTGNVNGALRFGIGKAGVVNTAARDFQFNRTYLLVVKYEFVAGSSNDIASLWVLDRATPSEALAGTPLATDASGTDPASITCIALRQSTSTATGKADEFRIANTWEDALGTYRYNGSWSPASPVDGCNTIIQENATMNSDLQLHDVWIASGKTLQMGSNELVIQHQLSGSGYLGGTSSSKLRIQDDASSVAFAPGCRSLKKLTLDSGAQLTLLTPLSITGGADPGCVLMGINSQLETGDSLLFQSDSAGTACLMPVGAGAVLLGKIGVERFLPARRAFRFLTTPVTSSDPVNLQWQTQTHITCSGAGCDASQSNSPSMFTLNPFSQQWEPVTSTTTMPLQQGMGYRMLVRGDRTINLFTPDPNPNAVVLRVYGTHNTGDKTYSNQTTPAIADSVGAYSFIGNPFPSPVNWNNMVRTNISPTYYTWRARGGSNNKGAYVSYNALAQAGSDGNVNGIIGSGAAFMVQTSGPQPSLTIPESAKTLMDQGTHILGKSRNPGILVQVFDSSGELLDGLYAYHNPASERGFEVTDSRKWMNPGMSLFAYTSDGVPCSIIGEKELNELTVWSTKVPVGNCRIMVRCLGWDGSSMELSQANSNETVRWKDSVLVNLNVGSAIESPSAWFTIRNVSQSNGIQEHIAPTLQIYPNPAQTSVEVRSNRTFPFKYEIRSIDGSLCQQGIVEPASGNIDLHDLKPGYYLLIAEGQAKRLFITSNP